MKNTYDTPPRQRQGERRRIYYREAYEALMRLDSILSSHSDARESVLKMTNVLLNKGRRVVLYLGAGCSIAVDVSVPRGHAEFRGKSWIELLDALLHTFPRQKQDDFFQSLDHRADKNEPKFSPPTISPYLKYFDKLQLAWYLTGFFRDREQRDDEISKIVEPPIGADSQSALHEQMFLLPFDDIITTNYDSHIARFLERSNESYSEITDSSKLVVTKAQPGHRVFYLHGKVGASSLVFDRFDYARLLAERDGILDYITYLLMDSHVLYVGFGLDDPTFNLMETRLQTLHGLYRPQSFALIPDVTDLERRAWRGRGLEIVDYGRGSLPEVFECVNKILDFLTWAEPHRPKSVPVSDDADRTARYMTEALRHYVRGDFNKCLLEARAALASTLLWERPRPSDGGAPSWSLRVASRLCDIRMRLALSHYKLLWTAGGDENHDRALSENVQAVHAILAGLRTGGDGLSADQLRTLRAIENSLAILEARRAYHEGAFGQARTLYRGVLRSGQVEDLLTEDMQGSTGDAISEPLLSRLRFAEGHWYATCQLSRIAYQTFEGESGNGLDDRDNQVGELLGVVGAIKKVRVFLLGRSEKCRATPEWLYLSNSLHTLHRIALWTAGRHATGAYRDVIPSKAERNGELVARLTRGIGLLEEDPEPDAEGGRDVSRRWLALRYRYLARAYALRWVVTRERKSSCDTDDADLVDAYRTIQDALHVAEGQGLERERVVNLLEAARLNVLAMFGERVDGGSFDNAGRVSPLSYGAGLYYLDSAFRAMEPFRRGKMRIHWLLALGYRIAGYFALVAGPGRRAEMDRVKENADLYDFLQMTPDEMVKKVAREYTELASNLEEPTMFNRRVALFGDGFRAIQEELAR
jgi:hypothetical protein